MLCSVQKSSFPEAAQRSGCHYACTAIYGLRFRKLSGQHGCGMSVSVVMAFATPLSAAVTALRILLLSTRNVSIASVSCNRCLQMSDGKNDNAASAASDSSSDGEMWDVAEILAERTSVSGENEVLVLWKPSWIPKSNLSEGPILELYSDSYKWKFSSASGAMRLFLPVAPGTALAEDCASIRADMRAASATCNISAKTKNNSVSRTPKRDRTEPGPPPATQLAGSVAVASDATGPRKQLGSTAKRIHH
jgi:hypothetical protein